MWTELYTAERDMNVRLKDNHQEVGQRQLVKSVRQAGGSVSESLVNAVSAGLKESAKLAKAGLQGIRSYSAGPQTP
jgi:hypothetical protein